MVFRDTIDVPVGRLFFVNPAPRPYPIFVVPPSGAEYAIRGLGVLPFGIFIIVLLRAPVCGFPWGWVNGNEF